MKISDFKAHFTEGYKTGIKNLKLSKSAHYKLFNS